MWTSFKIWLFQWMFLPTRLLRAVWSWVYQKLGRYESKAKKGYLTPVLAQREMNKVVWRADTWRELGDASGSPHRFQYILNEIAKTGKQPKIASDCDDYASWAQYVLKPEYEPLILSFYYIRDGKLQGHAVCGFVDYHSRDTTGIGHIGNWGLRPACRDLRELLKISLGVNDQGTSVRTHFLSWCVYSPSNMWVDCYGHGLPVSGFIPWRWALRIKDSVG